MSLKTWIELDPIYLTDFKKRPIEVLLFFNRVHYNPDTKLPTLRRRQNMQMVSVNTKAEVEEAVVTFCQQPNVRLLKDGLSANDFRRLPREVRRPPKDVVDGTADIYAND